MDSANNTEQFEQKTRTEMEDGYRRMQEAEAIMVNELKRLSRMKCIVCMREITAAEALKKRDDIMKRNSK